MHLYLSPHHDDVCFSLGHGAALTGGALVNVFTRSAWVAIPRDLPAGREARIAAISALRAGEDARFAAAAGLERHDLGLAEPPLVGRDPFDVRELKEEVDLLSATLAPKVLQLLGAAGGVAMPVLHCPMGIGGHRNHLSTLMAVRRLWPELAGRCELRCYEDLHYASAAAARERGLTFFASLFDGWARTPLVTVLSPQDAGCKLERIGFYASQHPRPPEMRQFTPASGLADGPHEIEWRVGPGRA